MGDAQLSWDEELSRALAGDYVSGLQAYVRRLVHDDQLAEDIVQETLLRAWKRAGQLPPRARRAWMFTTARHLVIDAHRARKARPPETSGDQWDAAVENDSIESALDAVLLTDALNALSTGRCCSTATTGARRRRRSPPRAGSHQARSGPGSTTPSVRSGWLCRNGG